MEITSTSSIQSVFSVFNVVRPFTVIAASFFLALIITPLWWQAMKKFKLGKQMRLAEQAPIFSQLHKSKAGTPTTGGVIIWLTVFILAMVFAACSHFIDGFWGKMDFVSRSQTWLPLAALVAAGLLGFADDLLGVFKIGPRGGGMTMKLRLIMYTLVALVGAWWFYYKLEFNSINIPFLGDYTIGWWYIPIFILIIVATAFSANETDGLDGLAGGVFLTMFGAYAIIAFDQGRMDLVVFIAAIMGALVAFLWHNIYPAKFFMGDTGSMSLGVVLGIVAMLTETPILLIPIGAIFLIESLSVIVQIFSKKFRGRKIFLSTPIHHHFEAKGWPESRVTMRFWMISVIGALIGVTIFLVDSKIPPLNHRLPADRVQNTIQNP